MGIISVNGLRIQAFHGVTEQERVVGNDFVVSVSIDVPMSDKAMKSDSLDDTINYAELIHIIKKEMAKPSSLIEHVAGRIRKEIESHWPDIVVGGTVTVEKLAPPVSVELDSVSYTTKW